MVDFDSARHHFASLQKGKKKDEAKIAKVTAGLCVSVCVLYRLMNVRLSMFILKFKGIVQSFDLRGYKLLFAWTIYSSLKNYCITFNLRINSFYNH